MMNPSLPPESPHLGRRLRRIDPALRGRMHAALEDAGVTRRQWRILAALEDAPHSTDELEAAEHAHTRRHRGRDADPDREAACGHEHRNDREPAEGGARLPLGRGGSPRARRWFAPIHRGFGPGPYGGFGPGLRGGFGPHRAPRRPVAELLAGLETRGWVERDGDAWRLTATGATESARIRTAIDAARARVREGVSDDDWATTLRVLDRVAENLRGREA